MSTSRQAKPLARGRGQMTSSDPQAVGGALWPHTTTANDSCPACAAATPPMARFCPQCGSSLSRESTGVISPTSLVGSTERRQLTAVFCDLVGSSELATRMDPEDFAVVIGRFHRCVRETMERYGGSFVRPMGDGALVFFGYPRANEDDAERAVRASLASVQAMSAIDDSDGYPFHVKIGIATGITVIGDVGEIGALDAAGEAVNMAARLQELAEPDTVLIADNVQQLIGPLFVYRDLGMRAIKGWKEPIQVIQVQRSAANLSRFEARTGSQLTPLIGRGVEMSRLHELWAIARSGLGHVAFLKGDAGIGKSRLAAQLLAETELEKHTLLQWFAAAHQQGVALHPCIRQIERVSGIKEDDSPELRRAKLETVLSDAPEEDFVLIASLLMAQVNEHSPVLQYPPQRRRELTLLALVNWLTRLCRQSPVLAVFDDAHWCDPTTAELLSLVVRQAHSLPLLLVITARSEFTADWIDAPAVEHLPIVPLRPSESAELIRSMAGSDLPTPEVIEAIIDRCDGVPLFLEEVTKAILEGAEKVRGDRETAPVQQTQAAVPQSIHASLLARLDRLGAARSVAEAAAAIGREFSVDLLEHVHDASQISLAGAISHLVSAGLILPSGRRSGRFRFKHSLIQDTAYGIMVRERRRATHRRIAVALEAHFPQTALSEPQQLARHYTEAGLIDVSVSWWMRAGIQSLQRGATSEASVHLRRGLELCTSLPETEARRRQELELQLVLAKVIIATQGHAAPDAAEAFDRARVLCAGLEASPQLLTVLFGQWTRSLLRAEFVSAVQQTEELVNMARRSRDRVWRLIACYAAGFTYFALGSFGLASRYLRRGLDLFDPHRRVEYARPVVGDPRVLLNTYFAWERMCTGHIPEARSICDAAVTEARSLGQFYSLAHALSKQAYLELYIGTPTAALAAAEELQTLADQHGIAFFQAAATLFRGWCCAEFGDAAAGLAIVEQATELYRRTGTLLHVPSFLRVEAELHGKCGHFDSGLARTGEALRMAAESSERWEEAEIRRTEGELLARAGRTAAAETAFAEASRVARAQGAHLFSLRAELSRAELFAKSNQRSKALVALKPAIKRWGATCDTPDLSHARRLLAELG